MMMRFWCRPESQSDRAGAFTAQYTDGEKHAVSAVFLDIGQVPIAGAWPARISSGPRNRPTEASQPSISAFSGI